MTRVALLTRKDQMVKEDPNFDRKEIYLLSVAHELSERVGKGYRHPGLRERISRSF